MSAPAVEQLTHEHDCAKRAVLEFAAYVRTHRPASDQATALDRWLRGHLTSAYTWEPGTVAARIQGLADGLAEVGQL